jgi:signal transduction histidine kinase
VNLLYLLRDEVATENGQRYVAAAERELSRVIEITRQTLQFYRESSKPVDVHVGSLVDEVLALYRRKLTNKEIAIAKEIGDCHPVRVLPGELRQVISNLVVNAIDATARGGKMRVRLKESRSRIGDQLPGILLLVGDNGSGIPRQSMRRIGDAFFTTKGQQGTGLGMWVTVGILKKYNGRMHIASSTRPHRQGTVISVFLPYAAAINESTQRLAS